MTNEETNISVNIDGKEVHLSFFYDRKNSETMFDGKSDYLNITMVGLDDVNPLHYKPMCIMALNGVDVDNKQKASVLYDAAKRLLEKYYEDTPKKDA